MGASQGETDIAPDLTYPKKPFFLPGLRGLFQPLRRIVVDRGMQIQQYGVNSRMIARFSCLVITGLGVFVSFSVFADRAKLDRDFQQLPAVSEDELPELPNQPGAFPGVLKHDGLKASAWVNFPFVSNVGGIAIDPSGALFVCEANRLWLGVPDLRGTNQLIREDFQARTVADRLALYEKYNDEFPEGWFEAVADRVIRLEDRDGNGAADHRTVFRDDFSRPEDGIGFSLLAERDAVYFTCIPSLWQLTDSDGDGVAEGKESLADGFGVRVSFIGHDLHGVVRAPDGRLYFSVGDRGHEIEGGDDGVPPFGALTGTGTVFRCDDDGSNLEVFATGFRNPQELAFDDYGNLFTFDNTGDIGDRARFVYVLPGSNSGWDMSHQSAHHYAKHLDWGEFRPPSSVWVEEKMFETAEANQALWVYPPGSHVSEGPSGFLWTSGAAVPQDLQHKFVLTNYRGAAESSTTLVVDHRPEGAGFVAEGKELLRGVALSDIELHPDSRFFLGDFGGGWTVNKTGAIHVLQASDPSLREAGVVAGAILGAGPADLTVDTLVDLLAHSDRRLRQMAQFALVERGEVDRLVAVAHDEEADLQPRLHAAWGLGQLLRSDGSSELVDALLKLAQSRDAELRANAARLFGDLQFEAAADSMLSLLTDSSARVRSLAAAGLFRRGSAEFEALFAAQLEEPDVVLRHAIVIGLFRQGNLAALMEKADAASVEERLMAVLALRKLAAVSDSIDASAVAEFLSDPDAAIRAEAIRAIYDTDLLDRKGAFFLASIDPAGLHVAVQRRVVAANYRLGTPESARRMLEFAGDADLDSGVRQYALHGLRMWEASIDTDPVLGHYRPQVHRESRAMTTLGEAIATPLRSFLSADQGPELSALATFLADASGVTLDPETLRSQVGDASLDSQLRVATVRSLAQLDRRQDDALLASLMQEKDGAVRAAALELGLARGYEGAEQAAVDAISSAPLPAARAAIAGLDKSLVEEHWRERAEKLRPELHLDAYLALIESSSQVQGWATQAQNNPQTLTLEGGDPVQGEVVFRSQGACLQCHLIHGDGGLQGPDLSRVAERLQPAALLDSLLNPSAEIAEGYGISSLKTTGGATLAGRIAKDTDQGITIVALDGTETEVPRAEVASLAPPVSAMPPMALALPLADLRDLMAFLQTRVAEVDAKVRDAAAHGDEEITK